MKKEIPFSNGNLDAKETFDQILKETEVDEKKKTFSLVETLQNILFTH